jgi:FAD/FMN-containing dehydrogenase
VVTEARLRLLPAPAAVLGGVIFFANDDSALDAVDNWRSSAAPRMLEYFDAPSLALLRGPFPEIPAAARAAILFEQELSSATDTEIIETWLARIETSHGLGESWLAETPGDRERFRRFRHALPELVNDTIRRNGTLKMGSDHAVPIDRNREMLAFYRRRLETEFPGRYVIFGHIGDAHVHVNILPLQDHAERATALLAEFAAHAVSLGGTVSAEHGLGKRKAHLLALQYAPEQLEMMRAVKRRLDPQNILGRGTLFGALDKRDC